MRKFAKNISRVIALSLVLVMIAFSLGSCVEKTLSEIETVKSEHFTVTAGMLSYNLYDTYYYYQNTYGDTLLSYYFGIDTSVALQDQYYDEESGVTWFDVFLDDALNNGFLVAMAICEAALDDGIELNEVDKKFIDSEIAEINSLAEEEGKTFEKYVTELYGEGVTEQDIRSTLEIYRLANKKLYKDYEITQITDEQIEEYVSQDPDYYLCRDVVYFTLKLSNETDKNEVIKTYAEKLASATTTAEFDAYAQEFINSGYCVDVSEETSSVPTVLNASYQNTTADDEKTDFEKWLFAEDTAVNSAYVVENSTDYMVYMAVSELARDMSETRNMYHIRFSSDIYDSESNAALVANNTYDAWVENGSDLEEFKSLALKYTTDYATAYTGGYYANVAQGDLTAELDTWLFDESRAAGDSAVIKTEYGVHIIYYEGEGEPYWKVPVIQTLKDEITAEMMAEYQELYKIEVLEDNLQYIK